MTGVGALYAPETVVPSRSAVQQDQPAPAASQRL